MLSTLLNQSSNPKGGGIITTPTVTPYRGVKSNEQVAAQQHRQQQVPLVQMRQGSKDKRENEQDRGDSKQFYSRKFSIKLRRCAMRQNFLENRE